MRIYDCDWRRLIVYNNNIIIVHFVKKQSAYYSSGIDCIKYELKNM